MAVIPQLGGNKQLFTGDARLSDGRTNAFLIAISGSSIDVAVAHLQRFRDHLLGFFRLDFEHTVTELRNSIAVIEGDGRDNRRIKFRSCVLLAHDIENTRKMRMRKGPVPTASRSEEHTSELQSRFDLVCRLLLEKKKHKEI